MTAETTSEHNFHPEGLTSNQEKLALMFFDTKTLGKTRRRFQNPDASYRFEGTSREMAIIDFARDEFEFAITEHIMGKPEAPLAPFFINLRNLSPEVLHQVGVVLNELVSFFEREGHLPGPDFCAGIPKAGVPIANAYAKISGIPMVEIFDKEENSDGTRRILHKKESGNGENIRLIDDLVSQGISKLESVREAQEMGYHIGSFFVLVDRQQGGIEKLKEVVTDVKAAMTITQILNFGLRNQRLDKKLYDRAVSYLLKAT